MNEAITYSEESTAPGSTLPEEVRQGPGLSQPGPGYTTCSTEPGQRLVSQQAGNTGAFWKETACNQPGSAEYAPHAAQSCDVGLKAAVRNEEGECGNEE